jgi:quercetin dioxygenase-like cupin family protein
MKAKWTVAVLVGLVGLAVYAANVLATPGSGFTAAQQWKGAFDAIDLKQRPTGSDTRPWKNLPGPTSKPKWFWDALEEYQRRRASSIELELMTKSASDVWVTRNAIAPGGHSGWHTHPGPSLIVVTAGEIMAYEGDDRTCTPKRYTAGQGFIDPGGGHVHLLRNETGAPAETVAVQILPKDAQRRLDVPAPGNCPF